MSDNYLYYESRKYGNTIVVFDGYEEDLSMKNYVYSRRSGGRGESLVDFTNVIVMCSKNEDDLSKNTRRTNKGSYVS